MKELIPVSLKEIKKLADFQNFLDFFSQYHALKNISSEHYHRLVEKTRLIFEYSGLGKPEQHQERYIYIDNILVVLPPDPSDTEKETGIWIAQESAPRVRDYAKKFGFAQDMVLPVIMYRTDDEVALVAKNPPWAGMVSLSYAPFFTTFNCQALAYANEKLGDDLAKKVVRYNFLHEHGHPMLERKRWLLAQAAGHSLADYAETNRSLIQANHSAYESAANDIQDDFSGFPYGVANLETRHEIITPRNVINYSYTPSGPPDVLSGKMAEVMYPLKTGTIYEIPFVTSPQVAHAEAIDLEILAKIKKEVSDFTWTQFLLDHIRVDPLVRNNIAMPDFILQIIADLQ